jgi:glycosyltransferase involved in cell wall biosynthesis
MGARPLHIAWLGAGPSETGGVPGVAMELLCGLAEIGHTIDLYIPGVPREVPPRLAAEKNIEIVWGTADWRWDRWYNRTKLGAFLSGLASRTVSAMRLRREVRERHEQRRPYDVVYQFSSIEALSVPGRVRETVPIAIHPETHARGELRWMVAERRLALRAQPAHTVAVAMAVMWVRALIQRRRIHRASLLVCISSVFRDHLVGDYEFPESRTIVVPNPVRLARFAEADLSRALGQPASVLVLGRIAVRKGVEDAIAVAKLLRDRHVDARVLVTGGPALWSDYTKLLEDLPPENSEFTGRCPPAEMPDRLASSDVLIQASKYEPFALTVGEALAAGVPVAATTAVGASEGVDPGALIAVAPGDIEGLAGATEALLERLREQPERTRALARSEATRLFAPEVVCAQISNALEQLVDDAN